MAFSEAILCQQVPPAVLQQLHSAAGPAGTQQQQASLSQVLLQQLRLLARSAQPEPDQVLLAVAAVRQQELGLQVRLKAASSYPRPAMQHAARAARPGETHSSQLRPKTCKAASVEYSAHARNVCTAMKSNLKLC